MCHLLLQLQHTLRVVRSYVESNALVPIGEDPRSLHKVIDLRAEYVLLAECDPPHVNADDMDVCARAAHARMQD